MPKFRFLLLDAGIIIGAHELGVWDHLTQQCEVTVTGTVKVEADFWYDEHGEGHDIDLDIDIEAGRLSCTDVPLAQVAAFSRRFGPSYLDRMDPGEAESLAYLYSSEEEWLIASADSHVFRVLGCLGCGDRGISLEEILRKIGFGRALEWKYTKEFRKRYTLMGERDGVTGLGLRE